MRVFFTNAGGRRVTLPCLAFMILSVSVRAQEKLPVIQATSKFVDVIDGAKDRKGSWYIFPERKPDVYYVTFPRVPHRVVFRTDKDSIFFDTQYGSSYDFVILLNGKDSCLTRIVARERELLTYTNVRASHGQTSDTIPFTVGKNNKIYIAARINGSAPLNFQFDLGAGGSIMRKGAVNKVKLAFDGSITLTNSDGQNVVPTSSRNTLQVGSLEWNGNIRFAVADNMENFEDGLLGNNLFIDKVLEINYDRKVMVVHNSLPAVPTGFNKQTMVLDGAVPLMKASIVVGDEVFTDWYMFDTGYSGLLRINSTLSERHKLAGRVPTAFNPFKKTFVLPQFQIAGHTVTNLKAVVHKWGPNRSFEGIMGNDLLKRFNVILDNQRGDIYLQRNSSVK